MSEKLDRGNVFSSLRCETLSRTVIFRVTVIICSLIAGIVFSLTSYFTLSQFELDRANSSFESTADYVLKALRDDFVAKESGVLSMVKNMAYLQPNGSLWPNVAMPGFYDTNAALKRAASFAEVMFIPVVLPEQLSSFEDFLREYVATDPNIPSESYLGVYSLDANLVPYFDTTGVCFKLAMTGIATD